MASIGGKEAFLFAKTKGTKLLQYPDVQLTFKSTIADHDHQLLRIMNKDKKVHKLIVLLVILVFRYDVKMYTS